MSGGDPWHALRGLRIGCVKYLNSRPLICAYDGRVIFDHPSALAKMLAAGELDAALVPTFEAVRDPNYLLVDDVAVGCDGPVYSVFLAYRGELRDVRSIALDPASMSSANLLRVILAEYHQLRPAFGSAGDAQLLIGNQAIEFRRAEEGKSDWKFFDLGEEWKRCTGLPFVFAVWALRAGTNDVHAVADAFRKLRDTGCARIPELIGQEDFGDAELRRRYLTEWLRFDIGTQGREAVGMYCMLLAKHGLIANDSVPLAFI
ncbi:MAG: menaquinone biosynthesis protein [Chthoniobacteraceae bacterium]